MTEIMKVNQQADKERRGQWRTVRCWLKYFLCIYPTQTRTAGRRKTSKNEQKDAEMYTRISVHEKKNDANATNKKKNFASYKQGRLS